MRTEKIEGSRGGIQDACCRQEVIIMTTTAEVSAAEGRERRQKPGSIDCTDSKAAFSGLYHVLWILF